MTPIGACPSGREPDHLLGSLLRSLSAIKLLLLGFSINGGLVKYSGDLFKSGLFKSSLFKSKSAAEVEITAFF